MIIIVIVMVIFVSAKNQTYPVSLRDPVWLSISLTASCMDAVFFTNEALPYALQPSTMTFYTNTSGICPVCGMF